MHNVLENIDEFELNNIDLDTEYKEALKNTEFNTKKLNAWIWNHRTSNEIFAHLGIINQSRSREKYITQLILAGLLRPTRSKMNNPDQKYIAVIKNENKTEEQ